MIPVIFYLHGTIYVVSVFFYSFDFLINSLFCSWITISFESAGYLWRQLFRQFKDHYKDSKQVRVFDINQFDASYFYTKLGSPCYVNNGNYIDPQNAPCLDQSNHFFYDRVHLTSSMNKELAKEVARFIVQ